MFAMYNVKRDVFGITIAKIYENEGMELYNTQRNYVHNVLNDYITKDGSLDASKIEAEWFPSIKAHIFLSHSHKDISYAIGIAGCLKKKYNIDCFIDSLVWGYASNLLKQIDDQYCRLSNNRYNYLKRNQSTAHVYMLLEGALAKMINACECLFFLNTPNSTSVTDLTNNNATSSPWIYNELLIANTFPHRLPEQGVLLKEASKENYSLKVEYSIPLMGLPKISVKELIASAKRANNKTTRGILNQFYCDTGFPIEFKNGNTPK